MQDLVTLKVMWVHTVDGFPSEAFARHVAKYVQTDGGEHGRLPNSSSSEEEETGDE